MKRVITIESSDRRNNFMVGKLLKHFTVTCVLCEDNKHLVGTKRDIISRLVKMGWYQHQEIWFCSSHGRDIALDITNDYSMYEDKCICEFTDEFDHAHDCPTRRTMEAPREEEPIDLVEWLRQAEW